MMRIGTSLLSSPRLSGAVLVLLLSIGGGACAGDEDPQGPMPSTDGGIADDLRDSDEDGLRDTWELWVGDLTRFDPMLADTDDDGVPDGDEDEDGDGLTAGEEHDLAMAGSSPPHPLQLSLLVELDAMVGLTLEDAVLADATQAFAAIDRSNPGPNGVGLHFFWDERDVPAADLDGTFEMRFALFESHGPTQLDTTRYPVHRMIHVIVAARRTDVDGRGGEIVANADGEIERTGVFLFRSTLDELHPQCGRADAPPVELAEALAGTLVHELGHVLQLGHDTEVGGGVNPYNIMSVPSSCDGLQQRFRGIDNSDATLGATEDRQKPRFSSAAIALMRFDELVSVDTAVLVDGIGRDM